MTFQCRVGGGKSKYYIFKLQILITITTYFPEPLPDVLWRRSASGGNMPLGKIIIFLNHKSNQVFQYDEWKE